MVSEEINIVQPRWWRTAHNRVCVQFSPGSVHEKLLEEFSPKKIGPDTYLFSYNKSKFPYAEKIFDYVNKKFKATSEYDEQLIFKKKGSRGITRTLEELQSMPISECAAIRDFRAPAWLRKKNISVVKALSDIGIETIYDALFFLPKRYIDRTNPLENFNDVLEKEAVIVMGKINNVYINHGRMVRVVVELDINGKNVNTVFFSQPWIHRAFHRGDEVIISGKYGTYQRKPQIAGTTIEKYTHSSKPIVPVYRQSPQKGLTTKFLENLIDECLMESGHIPIPLYMDDKITTSISNSLRRVHSPANLEENRRALEDLALFELTLLQTIIQKERSISPKAKTVISTKNNSDPIMQDLMNNHLPFSLTADQQKAVETVVREMSTGHAENILLSADVGAGKTIIAQLASIRAVEAGHQAVLAAPTEVLARQLYDKTVDLISYRDDIKVAFLAGSIKAKERKEIEAKIKTGEISIIVGTHIVLTKYEMYKSLGFVCIDEQHKFGAKQRTAISDALSQKDNATPVIMQQTATSIPRSMAQAMFGSITMIRIQQKPSGRKPIKTKWINCKPNDVMEKRNNGVWRLMEREIESGNQAFIIAPFVTDSEFLEDVSSVQSLYTDLKELFPELKNRIAMIHGKMKATEIEETMIQVKAKKYDIIVASTVVEVGVDVPDATFIAIMSADRLGIASLHQLRGRVGRNSKQSYCVLVAQAQSETSETRLRALEKSNDGFQLAEEDLRNRGAGKLLGSKQSGDSEMKFATNVLNNEIMSISYDLACQIIFSHEKAKAVNDAELYFGTDISSVEFNNILI